MSRDPKIDRKSLKKPDGFVAKGTAVFEALFRERRNAVLLTAVVLGIGIAYYGYDAWANSRLTRGWNAYYKAEEAKGEERTAALKKAYEEAGNTRAGYMAAVTLGDHYADAASVKVDAERIKAVTGKERKADIKKKPGEEDFEERKDGEPSLSKEQAAQGASEWYGKALSFGGLLPAERELLNLDIGHALEVENKWDDAAKRYQSVVDMGGKTKPLALLHLGRMQEIKQDKEAARKTYQSIATDFGATEYATLARGYLRRMDSALLSTGKP